MAAVQNVDNSGQLVLMVSKSDATLLTRCSTATVSCQVAGTTSASCRAAHGTVEKQGTLAAKDLNWIPVTVTGSYAPPTPLAVPEKYPAIVVQVPN